MSITATAASAEAHTLSYESGVAVEVAINDNGEVSVLVFGQPPVDFSINVWREIVTFVENSLEVTSD